MITNKSQQVRVRWGSLGTTHSLAAENSSVLIVSSGFWIWMENIMSRLHVDRKSHIQATQPSTVLLLQDLLCAISSGHTTIYIIFTHHCKPKVYLIVFIKFCFDWNLRRTLLRNFYKKFYSLRRVYQSILKKYLKKMLIILK